MIYWNFCDAGVDIVLIIPDWMLRQAQKKGG